MISFSDIFSQPAAIDWLTRAYRADRLPHGLIFAGPVGVGKATTARALAAIFLCEHPTTVGDFPAACGKCESCLLIDSGTHPDFHVVTRDLIRYHDKTGKSKGIDLSIHVIVPEVVEPAMRKAAMGRGKVFVIEQAESMNPHAQNALLKTLEEPAGRTLIILLTDSPDSLLSTIRSRAQIVRFQPLPSKVVRRELLKRGHDDSLAARAELVAGGSLGVALKWIEDDVVDPANSLLNQMDGYFTGNLPADLPGWFKQAAEAYAKKQLEYDPLGSKEAATREGLGLYLRVAAEHVRRRMSETDDADQLDRACAAIESLARTELYLDQNVNVALAFQQLSVALERSVAGVR